MKSTRKNNSFHVEQHDLSDCGIACLLTVLRSFGGNIPLSQLREWSGTSRSGSTMLGLQQAAHKIGINAEGFEAEISHLKSLHYPAILHVINEYGLNHFVVCFGYHELIDSFEISDPATNQILFWTSHEVEKKWESKTLLLLKPTTSIKSGDSTSNKIHQLKWLYHFAKMDITLLQHLDRVQVRVYFHLLR